MANISVRANKLAELYVWLVHLGKLTTGTRNTCWYIYTCRQIFVINHSISEQKWNVHCGTWTVRDRVCGICWSSNLWRHLTPFAVSARASWLSVFVSAIISIRHGFSKYVCHFKQLGSICVWERWRYFRGGWSMGTMASLDMWSNLRWWKRWELTDLGLVAVWCACVCLVGLVFVGYSTW